MLTPIQLRRRFIQRSLLFPPHILVRLSSPEAYSRKKSIRDRLLNLFQDCLDNKDKLKEPGARSAPPDMSKRLPPDLIALIPPR